MFRRVSSSASGTTWQNACSPRNPKAAATRPSSRFPEPAFSYPISWMLLVCDVPSKSDADAVAFSSPTRRLAPQRHGGQRRPQREGKAPWN
eukprot:1258410-Pleurochrysis_carterae.AAC.2